MTSQFQVENRRPNEGETTTGEAANEAHQNGKVGNNDGEKDG